MLKRYILAFIVTIILIAIPSFVCWYIVQNYKVENVMVGEQDTINLDNKSTEYGYGRSLVKSINFSDETYITLSDSRVIKTKSAVTAKKGDMVEFYKYNESDEFYIVKLYRELPDKK